ncbi:MAG: hypothetical protein ACHQXK_02825 [Methanosarcina thermophila]|nr:hypothetical protein [Methanosarcina thermophila]NLU57181.1 hypothetical protein [Methanosarcina thermophila]GLI13103.1 hypothetical protein MTHERMMSTA1_02290 [Methanosarcina thermophila MST-A1]HOA67868.1 hypothetical protein [Methanosarcina thermophila]HPZ19126.1 hypothetical protein [Methanosarcina thermophila]HQD93828.1 hypothetical protein [Methanosarcina thermophila]
MIKKEKTVKPKIWTSAAIGILGACWSTRISGDGTGDKHAFSLRLGLKETRML